VRQIDGSTARLGAMERNTRRMRHCRRSRTRNRLGVPATTRPNATHVGQSRSAVVGECSPCIKDNAEWIQQSPGDTQTARHEGPCDLGVVCLAGRE